MNSYTTEASPPPTSLYDQQMNGLHIDGIFFAVLWVGSWVLFIWLWAWNHRPKPLPKIAPRRVEWQLPKDWRN
jgi:hypothetical protein